METISVKNYRSITDSGEIKICPLTVIVGKNNAGKSSFIRLFPLLKQTLERKISDALLWYGDYVDFGDFQHTISNRGTEESIKLSFSIMTHEKFYGRYSPRTNLSSFIVMVELSIKEQYIEQVNIVLFDQNISITINQKGFATILINGDDRPFAKKNLVAIRETGNIIPTIYELEKDSEGHYSIKGLDISEMIAYCEKYIYSTNAKREYTYSRLLYNGVDIGIGTKNEVLQNLQKKNISKFRNMKIFHKRFQKINNYILATKFLNIVARINSSLSNDMKQTNYLKPIRAMVNRYYRVQGINIDELDADGSNLPMILRNMSEPKLLAFEKWSKEKFGVVFSVKPGDGHLSLIIRDDVAGKIETNVADTGYGYSQMLPIVMILWMLHDKQQYFSYDEKIKNIVIEQPELHLHPAYQAKMIDVFVNVIKEAEKKGIIVKIIFETHSETMINRIGTLISERKISAEEVNILVFDKEEEETRITSRNFNENGLLVGWPIGFFSAEED